VVVAAVAAVEQAWDDARAPAAAGVTMLNNEVLVWM
jgi:hypothetical protein